MINTIKNENTNINSDDLNNLSEKDRKTNPSHLIIDEGVENIVISQSETPNAKSYRNFYPWEQNNADKILSYRSITKNFGKMNKATATLAKGTPIQSRTQIIYRRGTTSGGTTSETTGGGGGGSIVWKGISETYRADGKPITGKSIIKGNNGTFRPSKIALNAPLVFVVGGVPIEPKENGVLWYPGDETSREGYMWKKNGFGGLSNFHVYVCKTAYNSGKGWDEITQLAKELGITFTKKILVGFSAGAFHMYSGVLKRHSIGNWDLVHIVGPAISNQDSCNKHLEIASGKVYYIQAYGIDKTSELADAVYKKQIADKLPQNHVFTAKGHHEGAQMSANWIGQNIKFNVSITITSKATFESGGGPSGISVTALSPAELEKLRTKYKGQITEYLDKTASSGYKAPYPKGPTSRRKFTTLVNGLGLVGANNKLVVTNTKRYGNVTYVGIVEGNNILRPSASTPSGQSNGQLNVSLLVKVDGNDYMEKSAAESFLLMQQAAKAQNVTITVTSGYRPVGSRGSSGTGKEDHQLRESGRNRGRTQWASWYNYKNGGELAAEPGTSNHGLGRAADIAGTGTSPYNKGITLGHQWVMLNGWRWGWYWGEALGERWHFTWVPNISTVTAPAGTPYLYDQNDNLIK